jgi:dTDP-4-dehydrorhamnose 3,5-epimerase
VELYRQSWNLHTAPLVFVLMVTLRPGAIRGWAMHNLQDDRIIIVSGPSAGALRQPAGFADVRKS